MAAERETRNHASKSQSASLTLDKAMTILDCFDVAHSEWTFKAICSRTGIPRSTAHRLIKTLENRKYLAYNDQTGAYHLGSSMLRSAYLTLSHSELVRVAHPHLEALEARTLESVVLTIRTDQGPLIIDCVLTSRPFKPDVVVGSIMQGFKSAHSRIFLAFQDQAVDEASARELLQLAASDGIAARELDRIRQDGVAYDLQEWGPAKSAIGAPVFDSRGRVNASLAIICPGERLGTVEMKEFASAVREVAATLSNELGYRSSESE